MTTPLSEVWITDPDQAAFLSESNLFGLIAKRLAQFVMHKLKSAA